MNQDVRQLLSSVGFPSDAYRELKALERWEAVLSRWPLLAATHGQLVAQITSEQLGVEAAPRPRSNLPAEVPGERPQSSRRPTAQVVAVVCLAGGVGRTTIAANATAFLAQGGRRAMAVDLDPRNALGSHFGFEGSERVGIGLPLGPAQIAAYTARFRGSLSFVPFGLLPEADLDELEQSLAAQPGWLGQNLCAYLPEGCEFIVLDTPDRSSPLLDQALALADEVVVVLSAEASSVMTLPRTERLLNQRLGLAGKAERTSYLVNRFDARRELDRDLLAWLKGVLGERLLPFVLQADQLVGEAFARRRCLIQEPGDSQVLADLGALAEWINSRRERRLGKVVPIRPGLSTHR